MADDGLMVVVDSPPGFMTLRALGRRLAFQHQAWFPTCRANLTSTQRAVDNCASLLNLWGCCAMLVLYTQFLNVKERRLVMDQKKYGLLLNFIGYV